MSAVFLKLTTGNGKNWIKGAASVKGHEGWFGVQSFTWQLTVPVDPNTGLVTGRRQHHALEVVFDGAGSGPAIGSVVLTNATADAQIDVMGARAAAGKLAGGAKIVSVIKLAGVHVQSLVLQADGVNALPAHRMQLVYKSIAWTATDVSTSSLNDSWVLV